MTKIIIPVNNTGGLGAEVAEHFGRAPYFVLVELNDKGQIADIKTMANKGEHTGGSGHPHKNLLVLKPDVIIACGMGLGGLKTFQNAGINVLQTGVTTVKEVIADFNNGQLKELTGGCEQAREHYHLH